MSARSIPVTLTIDKVKNRVFEGETEEDTYLVSMSIQNCDHTGIGLGSNDTTTPAISQILCITTKKSTHLREMN